MNEFLEWLNRESKRLGLIPYGIHSEDSHIRIHVSQITKRLYIYPTALAIPVVLTRNFPLREVRLMGRISALGYLIPPINIPNCMECGEKIEEFWYNFITKEVDRNDTSTKGKRAVKLVEYALNKRMIPLRLDTLPIEFKINEVDDTKQQITGIDLSLMGNLTIQVKCDLNGGKKELGGTGNLFIQVAERNYLHQI